MAVFGIIIFGMTGVATTFDSKLNKPWDSGFLYENGTYITISQDHDKINTANYGNNDNTLSKGTPVIDSIMSLHLESLPSNLGTCQKLHTYAILLALEGDKILEKHQYDETVLSQHEQEKVKYLRELVSKTSNEFDKQSCLDVKSEWQTSQYYKILDKIAESDFEITDDKLMLNDLNYLKSELCESSNGLWDGQLNYCDGIYQESTCIEMGGTFIGCKPCSEDEYCANVCIETCHLP